MEIVVKWLHCYKREYLVIAHTRHIGHGYALIYRKIALIVLNGNFIESNSINMFSLSIFIRRSFIYADASSLYMCVYVSSHGTIAK